jgi:alanine racemase
MTSRGGLRWSVAEVDLAAIEHNVRLLRAAAAPSALWAVVKADGYGHGAVEVARAALDGGATGLCVALVSEGVALRQAGLVDVPVLVLSQQPDDELSQLVEAGLTATVYSAQAADALAAAAAARAVPVSVHLKVDTGMHRAGCRPEAVRDLARTLKAYAPWLRWDGIFTHLACADDPTHPVNDRQLLAFERVLDELDARPHLVHAANSAGALAHPRARFDLVRAGIAIYGIEPGPGVANRCGGLRPALRLSSRVSWVQRVEAGEGISYGWRTVLNRDTTVATVPIGYADGVSRHHAGRGEVLVGGRRRRILGAVTMDQLMVDCGDDDVSVGDEVVLIGQQGTEVVRVEDWAHWTGTIGYEVVCAISDRVPRRYVRPGH